MNEQHIGDTSEESTCGELVDRGRLYAIFFNPPGKPLGLQILRWQVVAVKYYGFTLAALSLEPLKLLQQRGLVYDFVTRFLAYLRPNDRSR